MFKERFTGPFFLINERHIYIALYFQHPEEYIHCMHPSTCVNISVDGEALLRQIMTCLNPEGIYSGTHPTQLSTHPSSASPVYTAVSLCLPSAGALPCLRELPELFSAGLKDSSNRERRRQHGKPPVAPCCLPAPRAFH